MTNIYIEPIPYIGINFITIGNEISTEKWLEFRNTVRLDHDQFRKYLWKTYDARFKGDPLLKLTGYEKELWFQSNEQKIALLMNWAY